MYMYIMYIRTNISIIRMYDNKETVGLVNSIAICQLNLLEMLREVPQRSRLDVPRIQKRLYLNIN
jgi:hypothetical protein